MITKIGRKLLATLILTLSAFSVAAQSEKSAEPVGIEQKTAGMTKQEGFFSFYWDKEKGRVWLEISRFEGEFLYVTSLATGLGSNPVGLDRTQLGDGRVVRFDRVGPRVLLVQPNLRYRALTDNSDERRAVEESFAQSVLWGAEIAAETGNRVLVDATSLIVSDAVDAAGRLQRSGQGDFKLDKMRSAVFLPRTKAFPDNTEFEATLTFAASRPGRLVSEVTPSADSVTVRQRHSFVRLPDSQYRPRLHDPRAASFGVTFADYAAPLDQPLEVRWIARHRLEKKDPASDVSEAVEPIVYYLDRGAPEPVRSALLEGARWWNEAFEAAGYRDAFRVELLPDGADALDVRYNVIQWVHRSTRGWSYGSSVTDPRTGEIIKGHVLLGSLRVRQDRMLFEGLSPVFASDSPRAGCGLAPAPSAEYLAAFDPEVQPVEVALARIRQLAAHEVGHTLGFAHNFAASVNGRASVMDYPAPLAKATEQGDLDLSDAYAVGIGEWDKIAVRYAYTDFPADDERQGLQAIIDEAISSNLLFLSDADARPPGAAHPLANLWDNGDDPVQALEEALRVRRIGLNRFGLGNVPLGRPLSELGDTLVPLYLHHRYQVEATGKMLGGVFYRYKLRGDNLPLQRPVPGQRQRRALDVLLRSLSPAELTLPDSLIPLLHPLPFGYRDERERFPSRTEPVFDPLAAARTAADLTLATLLQRERAARLIAQHTRDGDSPGLVEVIDRVLSATWGAASPPSRPEAAVARVVRDAALDRLIQLAGDVRASADVRSIASLKLRELGELLAGSTTAQGVDRAHSMEAQRRIQAFLDRPHPPAQNPEALQAPPGSPIGRSR